jgi:hypothetical protein
VSVSAANPLFGSTTARRFWARDRFSALAATLFTVQDLQSRPLSVVP